MKRFLLLTAVVISFLSGCASVPVESTERAAAAKSFNAPGEHKAGVYIFRKDTHMGAALKKTVWIDKECVGETAKGVFFYQEVEGDQSHTISTESEFSPNSLTVDMQSGMLYFFEQYIKWGVFVGGAGIKQVDEATGKQKLAKLQLATKGNCGR